MGSGKFVVAGLLAGLGDSMVKVGAAKREAALRELELTMRAMENDKNRTFEAGENDKRRTFDAGENEKTRAANEKKAAEDRAFEGKYKDAELENDKKRLGIEQQQENRLAKESNGLLGGGDGLSVGDNRLLTRIEGQFEDENGKVDSSAVARHLKSIGRNDLAKMYEGAEGETGGVDVNDPLWAQAQEMAAKETSGKAGWGSLDSTDFAEDGGNRSAYQNRRTQEIYQQLKTGKAPNADDKGKPAADSGGGGAPDAGGKGAAGQEQKTGGGAPKGAGTRANPYKASTQAEVDWFKSSAPAGAVIDVNGTLYTK